jgi:hypothetical protein
MLRPRKDVLELAARGQYDGYGQLLNTLRLARVNLKVAQLGLCMVDACAQAGLAILTDGRSQGFFRESFSTHHPGAAATFLERRLAEMK